MKKFIIIIFVCLCTICCMDSYNVYANDLPFNNAKTLEIYLRDSFTYDSDKTPENYFEYFQSPNVFEFNKRGDCDDFATYTNYYLKKMGYNSYPYIIYYIKKDEIVGHAITVFEDIDKTYSIFSNQWLITTNENDPIKAIKKEFPTWTKIYLWKQNHFGYISYQTFIEDTKIIAENKLLLLIFNNSKEDNDKLEGKK